jgi:hypothetical protein
MQINDDYIDTTLIQLEIAKKFAYLHASKENVEIKIEDSGLQEPNDEKTEFILIHGALSKENKIICRFLGQGDSEERALIDFYVQVWNYFSNVEEQD